MQICILSMQRVNNIGSQLQSYALKKMIEELGHSVKFIDIQRIDSDDRLLENQRQDFGYESQCVNGIFGKLKKIDKFFLNRLKNKYICRRHVASMEMFRKEILSICQNDNQRKYDLCVIGSDEVFNCLSRGAWGFTSQLFGNVEQADKVITYAACCGSTDVNQVPEAVQKRISESFKCVEGFSVRDNNTKEFTSKLTNRSVYVHLDPVLVGDFTRELENTRMPDFVTKKYCIVYSYFNRIYRKEDIDAIKQFCKKQNLKIVGVGAPQMWIKKNVVVSPFEAIKLFQNAAFVITDTFHGTILAAKYCGHFAVVVKDSNRNKLDDLLERIQMQKHKVDTFSAIEEVYDLEDSKPVIAKIVKEERIRSISYLEEQIG